MNGFWKKQQRLAFQKLFLLFATAHRKTTFQNGENENISYERYVAKQTGMATRTNRTIKFSELIATEVIIKNLLRIVMKPKKNN